MSVVPIFLFPKFLMDFELNFSMEGVCVGSKFWNLYIMHFSLFILIKESTSQKDASLLSFYYPFWHCCTSFWRFIQLIGSCLTLQMLQLAEYHANATATTKPLKRPSIRERKQKLLAFLRGTLLGIEFSNFVSVLIVFIHGRWLVLIITFLVTEKYEPVHAKWTTERCAVCRWVEDWDYNKIIICNRYFK